MPRRLDVKAIRDRLGLSQGDLAMHIWGDKSKYRERAISRWENGHNDPSPMAQQHLKRLLADHEKKTADAMPQPGKRKAVTKSADSATDDAMPTRGPSRAHTALPGLS